MSMSFGNRLGWVCVLATMAATHVGAQDAAKSQDAAGQKNAPRPGDFRPPENMVVRTFYLSSTTQADQNEVLTALRNLLDPRDRIFLVPSSSAVVLAAPPDQMQLAERLLHEVDKPRKLFRLTFTLTVLDAGKPLSVQHYAMETAAGQRTVFREMSQVPANGLSNDPGAQYHTLDVGISIDATPEEAAGQLRLKSKVEDTSIAPDSTEGTVKRPVTRVFSLEGTSVMTPGRPVQLGSLDVPGSTRQVRVDVLAELVK